MNLSDELQELATKLTALHEFLCTNQFSQLKPVDRILLLRQYGHMDQYAKVLQVRVNQLPIDQEARTFQSHEQRVIDELTELTKKVDALRAFKQSDKFLAIDTRNRGLLDEQFQFMKLYALTLVKRIGLFIPYSTGDTQ